MEGTTGETWGPAGASFGNPLLKGHGRGAKQGTDVAEAEGPGNPGQVRMEPACFLWFQAID